MKFQGGGYVKDWEDPWGCLELVGKEGAKGSDEDYSPLNEDADWEAGLGAGESCRTLHTLCAGKQ